VSPGPNVEPPLLVLSVCIVQALGWVLLIGEYAAQCYARIYDTIRYDRRD